MLYRCRSFFSAEAFIDVVVSHDDDEEVISCNGWEFQLLCEPKGAKLLYLPLVFEMNRESLRAVRELADMVGG